MEPARTTPRATKTPVPPCVSVLGRRSTTKPQQRSISSTFLWYLDKLSSFNFSGTDCVLLSPSEASVNICVLCMMRDCSALLKAENSWLRLTIISASGVRCSLGRVDLQWGDLSHTTRHNITHTQLVTHEQIWIINGCLIPAERLVWVHTYTIEYFFD